MSSSPRVAPKLVMLLDVVRRPIPRISVHAPKRDCSKRVREDGRLERLDHLVLDLVLNISYRIRIVRQRSPGPEPRGGDDALGRRQSGFEWLVEVGPEGVDGAKPNSPGEYEVDWNWV